MIPIPASVSHTLSALNELSLREFGVVLERFQGETVGIWNGMT
jgi:hypothetical protein